MVTFVKRAYFKNIFSNSTSLSEIVLNILYSYIVKLRFALILSVKYNHQ